MISESEALEQILAAVPVLPPEIVPLARALGRFASAPVRATVAMPSFDNSAMDGYAVRAAEAGVGARLRVTGEQPAGLDRGLSVAPGGCVRIFTGAPLPKGADAVVMQEDVARDGGHVVIRDGATPGEFVRRAGADLCAGQGILQAGQRIGAARIGILASQGLSEISVGRVPRVAVVTTGSELVPAGAARGAGEIFNSNGPMLAAMTRNVLGLGAEPVCLHAGDDAEALGGTLAEAMALADTVIVSGGVSVGDHDLVRPTLESLGVRTGFWRVRVKPGKPLLFGTRADACVFGLPGNPVSSFVTFLLFVRPALLRMAGADDAELALPSATARLSAPVRNPGDRPHYLRGSLHAQRGEFLPAPLQQSHALFGLSQADALLRLDADEERQAGETVRVFPL